MAEESAASSKTERRTGTGARFSAALGQHTAVIGSLLHKETLHRVQSPLEAILALLEPLMLLSVFCIAFYMFSRLPPYGPSTLLFMASGFLPYYFFLYVSRRMKAVGGNPTKRFPVEQTLDFVFVYLVLRMFDYTILGIVVFGGLYFYGISEAMPFDFGPVAQAFALLAMFSWGFGMFNIGITKLFPLWAYLFPALGRAFMIFSGIHFVSDFAPPNMRYIMSFNPLSQAVNLFRTGFYPQYPQLTLDVPYLTVCAIAAIFLGLVAERATRRMSAARRKF